MNIILADRQDITRAGLCYIIEQLSESKDIPMSRAEDKASLVQSLMLMSDAIIILDYTLFDLNDADELLVLALRFPNVRWILFSEDLTIDFVRQIVLSSPMFSVLMKESPLGEIRECIRSAIRGQRFICQRTAEQLIAPAISQSFGEMETPLTKTETEILKDIALGMTTREIAEKRFSSFHTVNTHRKNIFRKLSVNNAHEATKYALRAGLVDSAEYYI